MAMKEPSKAAYKAPHKTVYDKEPGNMEKIVLEPRRMAAKKRPETYRVAAYCRVSTDTDEQLGSFEAQVRAYTALIEAKPGWELAGIYADEGISGTQAAGRPQFLRMIQDCEEGKIDLIITKSISRFARNTMECLTYVRHLQNIGVHLFFESNNIDTRVAFSEMLLTILAAFAQEESRSISENTKWGIRKRFENGIARWCNIYGYKKDGESDYIVVPEQAVVVQKIFQMYELGSSITDIWKYLNQNRVPSPDGKDGWARSIVQKMLRNEKYVGDLMLQKFLTSDHISHRAVRNPCTEVPAYYIENHHTPIIDRKTYERVQVIRKMRGMGTALGRKKSKCIQYPFGQMLSCPYCGQPLHQRQIPNRGNSTHAQGWCCEVGLKACRGFIIRSVFVEEAVLRAYEMVDMGAVIQKKKMGKSAKTRAAAEMFCRVKEQHPKLESVEYHWVDDLIAKIMIGAHSYSPTQIRRMQAAGEPFVDDRTLTVFWKAGLKTTVPTGIVLDKDDPERLAERYRNYLENHKEYREQAKRQVEALYGPVDERAMANTIEANPDFDPAGMEAAYPDMEVK